jgi:hypothetical protein
MGANVTLINSGAVAAQEVEQREANSGQAKPDHLFLVSDIPRKFQSLGERFLGHELPETKQVVFEDSWVAV